MNVLNLKSFSVLVIVAISSWGGCASGAEPSLGAELAFQGVSGTVVFRGGIDHSIMPALSVPDPVFWVDAKISLFELVESETSLGRPVATVATNEFGDFDIPAEPGMYYCVLHDPQYRIGHITRGDGKREFPPELAVVDFRIVNVPKGGRVVVVFFEQQVVPQ